MVLNNQVSPGWTGQLSHIVVPVHYNLTLRPDIENLNFTGHADIELNTLEATDKIVLNAKDLSIFNVRLREESQGIPIFLDSSETIIDGETSTVSIKFPELIVNKTNIYLVLDFRGKINVESLLGLYRSSVEDEDKTEQHILSTQFEYDSARQVFPCWDEPGFKATFELRLEVDNNLTALSNTQVKTTHAIGNKKHVVFEKSPTMSTYTLAFVVGELEYIEEIYLGYQQTKNITCRIYTPPGQSNLTRFSMNATLRSLEFLENELQSPYQLSKLDLVAVPAHSNGAMENWGLLIFRQDLLITDELAYFDRNKIFSTYAIAHELAHQWFGNLITMNWWSDLWLNEGFASYFGMITSNDLYPEYDIRGNFYIDEFPNLWKIDTTKAINSVRSPVVNPQSLDEDNLIIIYNKGTSVLSMLNETLTQAVFMDSIREYINYFQYQTVSSSDLFGFILKDPKLELFRNWIEKPGFPVLVIKETEIPYSNLTRLDIEQHRFGQVDDTLWYIHLIVKSFAPGCEQNSVTFNTKTISIEVPHNYSYLVDVALFGYFYVRYPIENLLRLSEEKLSSHELIRLLSDTNNLIAHDPSSSFYLVPLIKSLNQVNDPLVWKIAVSVTEDYSIKWLNFPHLVTHVVQMKKQLYSKILSTYGFEFDKDESDLIADLRSQSIVNLAELGDDVVLEKVALIFNSSLGNFNKYNFTFLKTILRASLKSDNPYYYQTLFDIRTKLPSNASTVRYAIKDSLLFANPLHLKEILNWTLENYPKINVFKWIFGETPKNIETQKIIYNFFKKHWPTVVEIFSDLIEPIELIEGVTPNLITPQDIDDINFFVKENNVKEDFNLTSPYYKLKKNQQIMLDYFKIIQ